RIKLTCLRERAGRNNIRSPHDDGIDAAVEAVAHGRPVCPVPMGNVVDDDAVGRSELTSSKDVLAARGDGVDLAANSGQVESRVPDDIVPVCRELSTEEQEEPWQESARAKGWGKPGKCHHAWVCRDGSR